MARATTHVEHARAGRAGKKIREIAAEVRFRAGCELAGLIPCRKLEDQPFKPVFHRARHAGSHHGMRG